MLAIRRPNRLAFCGAGAAPPHRDTLAPSRQRPALTVERSPAHLSGNTLTLKFIDGKTEKHTVFPYSTATDPADKTLSNEKLCYDTMMLERLK